MKLHRPVRNFPSELSLYAFNFAYRPNMYNYTCPFLAEMINSQELCKKLYEFLKSIPDQNDSINFPLQKNIICEDVLNPHAIPHIDLCFDEVTLNWDIPKKVPISRYTIHNMNQSNEEILNPGHYTLIQNQKFLLAIRNLPECVELYIYKK